MVIGLALVSILASFAFADTFGEGEYTTQGPGKCYPGLVECYSDGGKTFPQPPVTTFDECVKAAGGRAYRWLNSYNKCLGSDGPGAG